MTALAGHPTVACVVVGAGPAGRAGASALARSGAEVTIVDEREVSLPELGVRCLPGTAVWGVNGTDLLAHSGDRVLRLRADRVLIATGALTRTTGSCPGPRPSIELAELLGARLRWDADLDAWVPIVDSDGRSSIPEVFLAGAVLGAADEQTSVEQARRAAHAMLTPLPENTFRPTEPAPVQLRRRRCPGELPAETIVCPCENVTAGAIRTAASTGWADLAGIRAVTRAGMGLCQGRACESAVAAVAELDHPSPSPAFAARTPIRPVPIAALLAAGSLVTGSVVTGSLVAEEPA